jgi:hypothetical protein
VVAAVKNDGFEVGIMRSLLIAILALMTVTLHHLRRRHDEINDDWNGSASEERRSSWPYWTIGIAVCVIVMTGMWNG